MVDKQELFVRVREYLLSHPEEVLRFLKNALFLRVGVPLDALRWFAEQAKGRKAPKDVQIEAVPPGVRVGATVDAMGAIVRASGVVYIDDIRLNAKELRFDLRLADVSATVLEDNDSLVATLLRSGNLDLSKPGNLVKYLPKRPPVLVEAEDDRISLDLMKLPALQNQKAERLIAMITPFISVGQVCTDWEHLDVVFRPFQDGLANALLAVREQL
jgi:hypothetical protein